MNLRLFAQSLDMKEVNELSNILWEIKREFAKQNCKPLSINEKELVASGEYINAIKAYRTRNDSSLFEAKMAVDSWRERK